MSQHIKLPRPTQHRASNISLPVLLLISSPATMAGAQRILALTTTTHLGLLLTTTFLSMRVCLSAAGVTAAMQQQEEGGAVEAEMGQQVMHLLCCTFASPSKPGCQTAVSRTIGWLKTIVQYAAPYCPARTALFASFAACDLIAAYAWLLWQQTAFTSWLIMQHLRLLLGA